MAAKPYSVRFMSGRGGNRTETFTVPDRKRAVVRHLSFVYWTGINDAGVLIVHGIPLYFGLGQAPRELVFEEVRFTAYEGETIACNVAGPDVSYAVDGFLFNDDDGTPDDADNSIDNRAAIGALPVDGFPA